MENKEYHWFESFEDFCHAMFSTCNMEPQPRAACGYFEAYKALKESYPIIYSDQSTWFNQNTLKKGYRLFAHFKGKEPVEITIGKVINGREIRNFHALEKLLLDGELNN